MAGASAGRSGAVSAAAADGEPDGGRVVELGQAANEATGGVEAGTICPKPGCAVGRITAGWGRGAWDSTG